MKEIEMQRTLIRHYSTITIDGRTYMQSYERPWESFLIATMIILLKTNPEVAKEIYGQLGVTLTDVSGNKVTLDDLMEEGNTTL